MLCFIISRKVKITNETQKRKKFMQYKKVLWLIECVKSGLINFVLEISHWMILHGGVDQLKLTAIKSIHCLRSVNSILCRRQPTYSKSSIDNHFHQFSYVNHFDVWVPHKLSLLDCISACNSLLKCNKNVLFLKQIVMGNEKWILYNNMEWKRSWNKWNEPPLTTLEASLPQKKMILYKW